MKVAVFSAKPHDREFLAPAAAERGVELGFFEPRLDRTTAPLADGFDAACAFVHDSVDRAVVDQLADAGVRLVALRCAGYNNVDVHHAAERGLAVARVPAYSPHAVAEHTVGLMLTLNRKFHRAYARVREGNFALEGLLGFDMRGKTAGVIGTGRIGAAVCRILGGFDCRVLAADPYPDESLGVTYVPREQLLAESDIVTLHCPLTPDTYHLIDHQAIESMKRGVMVINTSRGGLLDARAAIAGLKAGTIGSLGLDVYEEEADLFYENLSDRVIQDDVLARLLTFPNVVITSHQAFFTREALSEIARVTLQNIADFAAGGVTPENAVTVEMVRK
jgi:D-lactate dehydrogenase